MKRPPEYWKAARERYKSGETYAASRRVELQRNTLADRFRFVFQPIRSYHEISQVLGVSKQAIQQAERRIFFKIAQRMMDPNFRL